jgi:hypothetical protein
LSGGAKINTDHPGYSGSGFIDGYWTQGATTTFTVNVPTAGNYDVNLFFSSGGAAATISIYVNGVKIKQTSLSSAGGWNDWGNKAETLSLLSGNNNIAYKYDVGDTGNVNLDYILLDLEQISCSSSIPVADNGSFTDTVSAILNALMIQESVAGSENVSVANIATQKSVVDAGSGTDEAMINVSLSIPENGNANDDTNITVNFSIPDSGNANEVIAITTAILMADEGSAVEALQCLINAALTDGGNGLENLAIKNTLLVNDAASGNDILLTSISNYINDNVSGNDAISILSAVGVSDSALGEEILHIIASIYINDLGGEKIIDEPCTTTVPVNGIIKEDAVWIDNGNGGSYIKLIPDVNYSYGHIYIFWNEQYSIY